MLNNKFLLGGALSLLLVTSFSGAESFYQPDNFRSLVSDNRANQVGDSLTVLIVESTSAGARAGTDSDSGFDVSANSNDSVNFGKVGATFRRGSEDAANTRREGHFTGRISVQVIEASAFGMLKIQGAQTLVVNGEEQLVKVTGNVRNLDIRSDNTVLSSRVSDAHIEFNGKGVVADGQEPNVFAKLLGLFGL